MRKQISLSSTESLLSIRVPKKLGGKKVVLVEAEETGVQLAARKPAVKPVDILTEGLGGLFVPMQMVGLGRPLCVDPDISAKLIAGTVTETSTLEYNMELSAREREGLDAEELQVTTVLGQQAFYFLTLFDMGEGQDPKLDRPLPVAQAEFSKREAAITTLTSGVIGSCSRFSSLQHGPVAVGINTAAQAALTIKNGQLRRVCARLHANSFACSQAKTQAFLDQPSQCALVQCSHSFC